MQKHRGFTLIEILVVVAIIGVLASIIAVPLNTARKKARDVRRKVELGQIGRFLSASSCYMPVAGAGEHDLADLLVELRAKYPQYTNVFSQTPHDPGPGTDAQSFYKYIVTADGKNCVLYANLENDNEPATLPNISVPTPGGGKGVFEAPSSGWNGSPKYFQVSN